MFENIRNYVRLNKYPIVVGGVMFAIVAIPVLLTGGDLGEVIARARR